MKNKNQFLLLLICISFFSCNSAVKNPAIPISNIDTDFPITEKLEFNSFNKYDIFETCFCMIDDTILWAVKEGESDFGSCYNLNTGENLSVIASRGKASNELTEIEGFKIMCDSVQFYTGQNTIKVFAKKDIINNVPMGDRKFSMTTYPDSILTRRAAKLPNGSVLATIMPAFIENQKTNKINQNSVAIINNNETRTYETIKYESFDIDKAKGMELPANDLIKCAYADGLIEIKDNDMAVFAVSNQFIFYTFDIKNGNVVNEKRYTIMQRDKGEGSLRTTNDRQMRISNIITNDKYILCMVDGYLNEKDKDSKSSRKALFAFDWNLNPIKKFDLPNRENGYYIISNDCSSVYFSEFNEDGLTLYKADLNI